MMEEDTWLSVEDESNSSFADSDAIDSETEAELYSVIHYEQNLENLKCPAAKIEHVPTSNETKSIFLTEEKVEFNKSRLTNTLSHETVFFNNEPQNLNLVEKDKSSNSDKFNFSSSQNSEDINVNQTVMNTLSNKKKRKSDYDSSVSSNLVKKSFTGLNDSSDSDSIIWTDVDGSDGKELQTNLCDDVDGDIVYLSSESDSSFDCLPPSKKNDKNLRNMSMPNIKIGENVKDLWFVNEQDLRRSKYSRSRRYHDTAEDTCSNCHGKGHNYKICPLPKTIKCFICGGVGHPGSSCANRICGRCFNVGHDGKRCWRPSFRFCILCSMEGHVKEDCPDLWRRYHLTTRPGKIVHGQKSISASDSFLYCWNCGQGGHVGAICRESRGPKCYLRTWPCVVSYADPENLLQDRLNSNRERPHSFRRENHMNQMNIEFGANFNSKVNNKRKKGKNFKGENQLNTMNTTTKRQKKKNNRTQRWQQQKLKKAEREKNFPRTPKNSQSNCFNDPIPKSLEKILITRENQKERRRRRKLRKLLRKNNGSKNSLQTEV